MAKTIQHSDMEEAVTLVGSMWMDMEFLCNASRKKDWKRVHVGLLSHADNIRSLGKLLDKIQGVKPNKPGAREETDTPM